jgi:hypothetical protein
LQYIDKKQTTLLYIGKKNKPLQSLLYIASDDW